MDCDEDEDVSVIGRRSFGEVSFIRHRSTGELLMCKTLHNFTGSAPQMDSHQEVALSDSPHFLDPHRAIKGHHRSRERDGRLARPQHYSNTDSLITLSLPRTSFQTFLSFQRLYQHRNIHIPNACIRILAVSRLVKSTITCNLKYMKHNIHKSVRFTKITSNPGPIKFSGSIGLLGRPFDALPPQAFRAFQQPEDVTTGVPP
jgi:hypothetical protein